MPDMPMPTTSCLSDAAPDLLAACEATLLYHSAPRWGVVEVTRWHELMRRNEPATPQALCSFIRAAVMKAKGGRV